MVGAYHVLVTIGGFVWEHHRLLELAFLAAVLVSTVWNLRAAHILGLHDVEPGGEPGGLDAPVDAGATSGGVATADAPALPRVSVLVPARDEERTIGRCVESLLAQEYPDFEVLVLDDESTDTTAAVVAALARRSDRLRLIRGRPLPAGWLGKVWACHQLSEEADGELLLFTDADTWHHPRAVRDAVAELLSERADLVTGLPRQENETVAERVVVPVIAWATLAVMPLWLAQRVRWSFLAVGLGQLLLFRRGAYRAIGGHAAIRAEVVDDMALARRVKAAGGRWRFVDASRRISCRMYSDRQGVIEGLTKNIFPALGCNLTLAAVVFIFVGAAYLEPFVVLGMGAAGGSVDSSTLVWALVSIILALASWVVIARRGRLGALQPFLYPVTMAGVLFIGIRSVVVTLRGRATWKGRSLVHEDEPAL